VIIHPGGLGDVLLAVPAIARLRTRFSKHRLVLCAEDQVAKLLHACRIIDEWTSVHGRTCTDFFAGADAVTGQGQAWLQDCDLAIAWLEDVGGRLNETFKVLGVGEIIVRSPFSPTIYAAHQRDRFLEAIHEAPSHGEEDILLTITEPLLQVGKACLEAAGLSKKEPLVVIHPGSGSAHKCVAPEMLASLVVAIQVSGIAPVVLEGPADQEPVERLLQACVNPPIVLKGLDILTVAGVLAQAQLFIGQDSGVTHMATQIGVRTVVLFGPTDPARWAPRGSHVTVVKGAPCLCRSWDEVSLCKGKPCLEISKNHLVTICLTHLKEVVERQRVPSGCLVTDYPVC
jgi:heptosyltransferase III